ncbi:hypothetical protein [Actinomadura rugatobispora]|uniref:Uncharacterized protein n=1 Tax=Actinomadura rugatobispora TaxID=1994 RepID=A0ABW0ZPF8_9ACTN|nr:hypothetical protein GCM10010200_094440 [Actinomadura rugatobispora]
MTVTPGSTTADTDVKAQRPLQRLWMQGELHSSPADPVGALAAQLTRQADDDEITMRPWKATGSGTGGLVTTASWQDPVAGLVIVALALREATAAEGEGRVEWGLSAFADSGWSGAVTSPLNMLGLKGAGVHDLSGVPLFDGPIVVTDAPQWVQTLSPLVATGRLIAMGDEHEHQRIARALADPARSTAVLVVAMHAGRIPDGGELNAAAWPGACTVMLVDGRVRKYLAQQLPARPVPVGGARLFAAAAGAEQDLVLAKNVVRRPGWTEPLFAIAAGACTGRDPDGQAAEAARLLDDHPRLRRCSAVEPDLGTTRTLASTSLPTLRDHPAPVRAEPSTPERDDLAERAERDRAALAQARRDLAALSAGKQRLCEENQRLLAEIAELREQVEAARPQLDQIAQLTAERDAYVDECDLLTDERDLAVRERGVLALRLASLARTTEAAADAAVVDDGAVPGSMEDLLARAARQYPLLDFARLDMRPACALDQHPKADAWRRKISDALASLHHYATLKRGRLDAGQEPGPELASFYTFLRSGHTGALISAHIAAMGESDCSETNGRYRQARTFPVAPATDPSGRAYMGAHIKIDTLPPAPRLHFLDDIAGHGTVYIGYIGEHLVSARTN